MSYVKHISIFSALEFPSNSSIPWAIRHSKLVNLLKVLMCMLYIALILPVISRWLGPGYHTALLSVSRLALTSFRFWMVVVLTVANIMLYLWFLSTLGMLSCQWFRNRLVVNHYIICDKGQVLIYSGLIEIIKLTLSCGRCEQLGGCNTNERIAEKLHLVTQTASVSSWGWIYMDLW